MKQLFLFVGAAIALTSCSEFKSTGAHGLSVTSPDGPALALGVRLSPDRLLAGQFPLASCPFNRGFSTTFDLVAVGGADAGRLDRVNIQLLDGTHPGSPITFTQPALTSMFGSTSIDGTRTFRFSPQFGCVTAAPTAILVEAAFRALSGHLQTITMRGSF